MEVFANFLIILWYTVINVPMHKCPILAHLKRIINFGYFYSKLSLYLSRVTTRISQRRCTIIQIKLFILNKMFFLLLLMLNLIYDQINMIWILVNKAQIIYQLRVSSDMPFFLSRRKRIKWRLTGWESEVESYDKISVKFLERL